MQKKKRPKNIDSPCQSLCYPWLFETSKNMMTCRHQTALFIYAHIQRNFYSHPIDLSIQGLGGSITSWTAAHLCTVQRPKWIFYLIWFQAGWLLSLAARKAFSSAQALV